MARLIDADKLRKDILDLPNCYNGFSDAYDKAYIIDVIDEQPTVDIDAITETHEKIGFDKGYRDGYAQATVDAERHGHWIYTPTEPLGYVCSECGKSSCSFTYCPNCGAKMDEKEDGGTVTYYANDKPVETIVIDERKEYAKTD